MHRATKRSSRTTRFSALAALVGLAIGIGPSSGRATIIDDFEDAGERVDVSCASNCVLTLSDLPVDEVRGGSRQIRVFGPGEASGQSAGAGILPSSSPVGGAFVPELLANTRVDLAYLLGPPDLTEAGTLDTIELDIDFVRAGSSGEVTLTIFDSVGSHSESLAVTAPGVLEFPLSPFAADVDLTDVDQLRFANVPTAAGSGPFAWRITEIRAVPEPGTALSVALALAGGVVMRRRKPCG